MIHVLENSFSRYSDATPKKEEKKKKKRINKKEKKKEKLCNNLLTVPSSGVPGEHRYEERTLYTLENRIPVIQCSP